MVWDLETHTGRASELHARSSAALSGADPRRVVEVMTPSQPAVVLGSTQPEDQVDRAAAEREGVDVVRRRSGGGAVMVSREGVLWVDLIVPAGDELWDTDVGRATWWVGDSWAKALRSFHPAGEVAVWKAALRSTEWSTRVCFSGVGPGEVRIDGKKVVGVSQRRTRHAALFQTAALLEWRPATLARLLVLEPDDRRRAEHDLNDAAAAVPYPAGQLLEAFLAALPQ